MFQFSRIYSSSYTVLPSPPSTSTLITLGVRVNFIIFYVTAKCSVFNLFDCRLGAKVIRKHFHHQILCQLKRFSFLLSHLSFLLLLVKKRNDSQTTKIFLLAKSFFFPSLLAIRRDFIMHKEGGNENLQKIKSPLGSVLRLLSSGSLE